MISRGFSKKGGNVGRQALFDEKRLKSIGFNLVFDSQKRVETLGARHFLRNLAKPLV